MSRLMILSRRDEFHARLRALVEGTDYSATTYWVERLEEVDEMPTMCILDWEYLNTDRPEELVKLSYHLADAYLLAICSRDLSFEEKELLDSLEVRWLSGDGLTRNLLVHAIESGMEIMQLRVDLEKEQQKYVSLFHNSAEPSFFLDRNLSITSVNEAFLKTFELPIGSTVAKSIQDFIVSRNNFSAELEMLERGNGIDFKGYFSSEGEERNFLGRLKINPITRTELSDGELTHDITGYHGTLTNISYRERLEEMQRKSEQITLTYRLARMLAHEIRNPLTNINLAIDELKNSVEDEGLHVYFDIMSRCSIRIDNLLNQLLHASEINVHDREEFDVVSVIMEIVKTISDRARLEEIDLIEKYSVQTAPILGVRERMRIALMNLCTNAIESINHDEGEIKFSTHKEEGRFCFRIQDNGVGIDAQEVDRLFDPFYTTKKEGVGLGLTSTRTIIIEHDGEIFCESEKGKGTVFTVSLPMNN